MFLLRNQYSLCFSASLVPQGLYTDAKTMCNKVKFLEKTGFFAQVTTWLLKCRSEDNSVTNQHQDIWNSHDVVGAKVAADLFLE